MRGFIRIAVGILATTPMASTLSAQDRISFEERHLATISEGSKIHLRFATFSPTGTRVARIATIRNQERLVVNDQQGEGFDRVGLPAFSPDGKTLAYKAVRGSEYFVMVNDQKVGPYDYTSIRARPVFSADSKVMAYSAAKGGRWFAVINGKENEPEFDGIGYMAVSPDGTRVAYVARKGKEWFVVNGEKRGPSFDMIRSRVVFSPDGCTLAYFASEGNRWYLVANNKKSQKFYHDLPHQGPIFSAQGSSYVFAAGRNRKWFVVLNGEEGELFEKVHVAKISPDGKTVAYVATTDRPTNRQVIVHGTEKSPGYYMAYWPTFSPDGKRFAYAAFEGPTSSVLVEGGTVVARAPHITDLTFSADSKILAYAALIDHGWIAQAGNAKSAPVDTVYSPLRFSSDGKQVAFGAKVGRELWWKVLEVK